MISESNLAALVSQWQGRASHSRSADYRQAVSECMHDIQYALDDALLTEWLSSDALDCIPPKEVEDYFLGQEADDYLSSMAAHESVA